MRIPRQRKSFRLRISLGVSLGIIIFAFSIHRLLVHEPVYEGKTVGQWLAVIARDRIIEDEGEAFDALKGAGPEVVPYLIDALKKEDSKFDKIYNGVLQKLPTRLRDSLPPFRDVNYMRMKAESLLQIVSPACKQAALPELLALLNSPQEDVRDSAAATLREFGMDAKPAVPKLIEYLTNANWILRSAACEVLEAVGPEAKAAVPALVQLLQDDDTAAGLSAYAALYVIDPETWEKAR